MDISEIWDRLAKFNISRCSNEGEIEINQHNELMTSQSFYFDCLHIGDDTEVSNVFFSIDIKGNSEVSYADIIYCKNIRDVGPNFIIESLRNMLHQALHNFVNNKEDL